MKRIDDSHQPFKRTKKIGPGPRKRPAIHEHKEFTCKKGKNTKSHYVQICVYKGADGKKLTRKVKLSKAWKKAYNKVYQAWAASKRKALKNKGPKAGYVCRKTPSTKCK